MAAEFDLKIVTPEGLFLQAKASLVELLTGAGQIGVMSGHAPLITALEIGDLVVQRDHQREVYFAGGGFARIYPEHVLVMAMSISRRIDLEDFEGMCGRMRELMIDAADTAQIQNACDLARQRLAQTITLKPEIAEAAELDRDRIMSALKKRRR
jgi:F-type H+-transporting ATPase subunit epsilon